MLAQSIRSIPMVQPIRSRLARPMFWLGRPRPIRCLRYANHYQPNRVQLELLLLIQSLVTKHHLSKLDPMMNPKLVQQ